MVAGGAHQAVLNFDRTRLFTEILYRLSHLNNSNGAFIMKRKRLSSQIRKVLPVIVATSALSACVGQEGSTNGGFAGVGGSGATALGVIGGVVLAGALLADDDSSGSGDAAVGGTGDVADGGIVGTGDSDTDTGGDTGGNTGTGAGGGTGTDAGGDTGTDAGGDTGTDAGGGTGTDAGGDTGTDAGGDTGTDAGGDTGTDAGGDTGTDAGGDTDTGAGDDTGTDTGTTGTILEADGSFIGDVFADETLPQSNSIEVGMSDLSFNFANNTVDGCVFVPAGSTPAPTNPGDLSAVTLMIGPPGANGFPGIELEAVNADRTKWQVPGALSADQMNVLAENLESGNLYLAVRNNEFPNGELRRQILSNDVFKFGTTATSASGGTAEGFVLVNEATGDYSITWNTDDVTLAGAAIVNGFPGGAVVANLVQRASNPGRFFLNGNFNNSGDPLQNIQSLLADGMAGLVATGADGSTVFQGLLTKMDF